MSSTILSSIRLRSGISIFSITIDTPIHVIDGITSDLDSFVTYFNLGTIQLLGEWTPLPSKGHMKRMYISWKEYMGGKTYHTTPFKQMLKQLDSAQQKAIMLMRWIEERGGKKQENKGETAASTSTATSASTAIASATATLTATATATTSTRPAPCYGLDVICHRDMIPSAYRCIVCEKVANQAVTCQHGKIMGHACYKMGTAGCGCTSNQPVVLSSLRDSIGEVVARCPHHPSPTTETTIHLTLVTSGTDTNDGYINVATPETETETSTMTGCEWIGKLENLDNHLAECVWVPVTCPHQRCSSHQIGQGSIIRRGELSSHVTSCQYRSSPCPDCSVTMVYADIPQHQSTTCPDHVIGCINEGCHDKMPRKDLQSHIDICDHTLVVCSLGCGRSIPRGEISAHESDVGALSSHLTVLRDLIPSTTTSSMIPIRSSVDAIISRVAQLEQQQSQHMKSLDELKNQVSQLQTVYDTNENERKQQKESIIKLTNVLQQRVSTAKETTDIKLATITTELNDLKRMIETLTNAKAKETSTRSSGDFFVKQLYY